MHKKYPCNNNKWFYNQFVHCCWQLTCCLEPPPPGPPLPYGSSDSYLPPYGLGLRSASL